MRYPSFPTTPVLDSAERADENPATGWTGPIYSAGNGALKVASNTLCAHAAPSSRYFNAKGPFAADQEVYFTIAAEDAAWFFHVPFCLHGTLPDTPNGYLLNVSSQANTITVEKMANGAITAIGAAISQTLANGDSVGARRWGTTIEVWYKAAAGIWTRLGTREDATYSVGGSLGMILLSTSQQFTNYGGGTVKKPNRRFTGSNGSRGSSTVRTNN
jgi:hypothetical protein